MNRVRELYLGLITCSVVALIVYVSITATVMYCIALEMRQAFE